MAKKKYHYYVLVMTMTGPTYVTSVNVGTREARFEKGERPKEMPREDAQYLARGLTFRGNSAVCVSSEWEIDNQPFYYAMGEFKWEDKVNEQ